ncbi:Pyruvate:ferredoxin oxidoreductase [Aduncisulcus paluster]|nr:Pyruvate:ferredoxin oxidoreductase [Aduncisulcus paluster]
MKAMREAEAFPGPSIVIGFCPCIAWHLRGGLKESLTAEKLGVETGFWPLYRFNPEKRDRGEPPCSLDSEPPKFDNLNKFLSMQGRFSEARKDKAMYEALMSHLKDNVQKRYHVLELLSKETQYM